MRKFVRVMGTLSVFSVMALGVTMTAHADERNGWVEQGGIWYYYDSDKLYENEWVQTDDKWYFLDEDGRLATKKFIYDSEVYDSDDIVDQTDFKDSQYYYVDADGVMITGWHQADMKSGSPNNSEVWYYADGNGVLMGETWVLSGLDWYYLKENGQMASKEIMEDIGDDDEVFYFKDDGKMVSGWHKLTSDDAKIFNDYSASSGSRLRTAQQGDYIYADNDGSLVVDGWEQVDNQWYYFGETQVYDMDDISYDIDILKAATGTAVSGLSVIDKYIEGQDFIMVKESLIYDGSKHYYLDKNGAMVRSKFIDSKYDYSVYAGSDGDLVFDSEQFTVMENISNKNQIFADGILFSSKDVPYAGEIVLYGYNTFLPIFKDSVYIKDDKQITVGTSIENAREYLIWWVETNVGTAKIKKVYKLGSSITR